MKNGCLNFFPMFFCLPYILLKIFLSNFIRSFFKIFPLEDVHFVSSTYCFANDETFKKNHTMLFLLTLTVELLLFYIFPSLFYDFYIYFIKTDQIVFSLEFLINFDKTVKIFWKSRVDSYWKSKSITFSFWLYKKLCQWNK